MKKNILLVLAAACSFAACDPVQEDFSNGGHISIEEFMAKTSISVDKAPSGKNGNVITCTTSAPVNTKWVINGTEFKGNYAFKKMKVGEHKVIFNALCADGTMLVDSVVLNCEEITQELNKIWIYGQDPAKQPPFVPGAWDAAAMRFSDNEGRCQYGVDEAGEPLYTNLPYLADAVYKEKKTLIFELTDVSEDCDMRVMDGWWSATYYDHVPIFKEMKDGKWELQLNDAINTNCSRAEGGKDLDLMLYSGTMKVHSIYYEE